MPCIRLHTDVMVWVAFYLYISWYHWVIIIAISLLDNPAAQLVYIIRYLTAVTL